MYILGGLIVAGFFALLFLLTKQEVPEKNENMMNIVVGALISSFTMVCGFFYGSSTGSKEKTEILDNLNKPK